VTSPLLTEYVFWLAVVSTGCLVAERVVPWRKGQRLLRPQFGQDCFWLLFNGYLADFILVYLFKYAHAGLDSLFFLFAQSPPSEFSALASSPLWLQIGVVLVCADFIEYLVHNALHRNHQLWKIHRVHHSIVTMDWIGNFRFHWGEILLYRLVKYLPLAILGASWQAILVVAVISTTIGHINHSNLNISWGPIRYLLNSPRMHIWHHEKELRGKAGVNFAVVFSLWDWMFRTAYMPREALQPEALGFEGMEKVPTDVVRRFFVPWRNDEQPDKQS
jgi:sterol desaturase/sphingolipid hydroxylase (fatty acid hydroxylase superfamily)